MHLLRQRPRKTMPVEPAAPVANSWYESRRKRMPHVGLPSQQLADPEQRARVEPRLRSFVEEPQVVEAIQRDAVPIPHPSDREGYHADSHLNYWLSGADDLRTLQRLTPEADFSHVLDFGGASGRVARHLALLSQVQSVVLADINFDHVLWVDEHFDRKVRPVKVEAQPHFPLADGSITLCIGFSVFTHLDATETGWLADVHRVLADGGRAYLTIHSEHTWQDMCGVLANAVAADPAYAEIVNAGGAMPDRVAFDYKPGTQYHCCNTFMSLNYIRRSWGRWFEIEGLHPKAHNRQTVVVLRKHA
jgi:SAM-dependent methyltransferase